MPLEENKTANLRFLVAEWEEVGYVSEKLMIYFAEITFKVWFWINYFKGEGVLHK